jgi:hypothetical protein
MILVVLDLLMLMPYPDTTHDHDITEDPMLEGFTVLLTDKQIIKWPPLERLVSTLMAS